MGTPTAQRQSWFIHRSGRRLYSFSHASKPQLCLFVALVASTVLFMRFLHPSDLVPRLQHPHLTAPIVQSESDHPLLSLVRAARLGSAAVSVKQSQSLEQVVAEYRRRYGLDPPPHFDKWYEYATTNDIPLLDEYDGIHEVLRPFWAISPAAIRRRVKDAIDADDFLNGLFIRNGTIKSAGRGEEWRQNGPKSAIEPFAHLLPDMDLAINKHDEPRVIIPHDQLAQMLERSQRAQKSHITRHDTWSARPAELNDGFTELNSVTPFLEYAQQFTWPVATLSCPPDSPARILQYNGADPIDDSSAYLFDNLGFIYNRTAFTDICLSPSLRHLHGFFNKPNAWSITHDPIPILSPSKISTFHDILFPAPWYLADRSVYEDDQDLLWEEKRDDLYWRGKTTSGYSAGGTWHFQGRQRFIESVEKPGTNHVLRKANDDGWQAKEVAREQYQDLLDVHFTSVDQCSEEDCAEQLQYFDVRSNDPFNVNFKHKALLDMDGNAFSGRFYAFLQSRSLVLKQALFREWHEDRIVPWVHYIPLGLNGTDHLEIMRYLTQEEEGQRLAREIAEGSREWARRSLRKVDMQAWMFRLLLEYARLLDDRRDELGFMG
ncbi:hypothetical protein LTR70_010269 [Exophiala xenobiotica]|uniref:Glycosyl transferase CAP10 domain-containing protein n=1 Tax=Lithohypha guttulata TaxID=1690604 RepID=A0ABR0JUY6_9EURO|nr:hypothetical protein LTR24_010092 [Lithohypha guttulata]KAK5309456.1 hypothetical protein LTR70_010269 [Exophiala xenobiotica]